MRSLAMSLIAAAAPGVVGCAGPSAQKTASHDKPGFATEVRDGRLWVFKKDSKELAEFKAKGPPARQVTRIGAGPNGMTMKATDGAVIDAYLAAK